ncbi:MAG: hypothetical protein LKI24_13615 [Acidipropionibacterium sp.]|jgi:hypothetical protein|nr:hypothetical protein [Acidipropionibacterium sp.]
MADAMTDSKPLDTDEIKFVHRLEAAGHRVRWIPRDIIGGKPTNDFVWLTGGNIECELKSTKARYGTIKGAVQRAVVGSGGVKDTFVVDIGVRHLTSKLRFQLAQYNTKVETGAIRRLFVMSDDGASFEEIRLHEK